MGCKRPLHLLFVCADPVLGAQALAATRAHAIRITARASAFAHESDAAWADLVVTFDDAARSGVAHLPPRVQRRHLGLDAVSDEQARERLLAQRIAGIVGGLRLLERGDE